MGADITSNNPIVISNCGLTIAIRNVSTKRDTAIVQRVPKDKIGKEYVLLKGMVLQKQNFPLL